MNGKLVMEVTITEVLHPLLFERLRECASARERAAIFKACAEAYLRGDSTRETRDDNESEDVPDRTGSATGATSHSRHARTVSALDGGESNEFMPLGTGDSDGMSGDFGDALGGFLDKY